MTPLQYQLINKIMTNPVIDNGMLLEAGDLIVTALISGLGIKRAGIWLYPDTLRDRLKSHLIIDHFHQTRDTTTEISRKQFPAYFSALDKEIVINADDAQSNSFTSEFKHGYLDVLNIYSMLDAPIRINGKTVGVVCCEQINQAIQWSENDVLFATLLADQFGRTMAAEEKITQYKELRRTTKELDNKTDNLKALHKSLDRFSLIATMDFNGNITDINENFLSISGYVKTELIGQSYHIFESEENSSNLFNNIINKLQTGHIWQGKICHSKKDNETFWAESTISPIKNGLGKIEGYIGLFYDITHEIETERQLNKAEKLAKMGSFRCHLHNEVWSCSLNFKEILGLSVNQSMSWLYLQEILTCDDYDILKNAYLTLPSNEKLDITVSPCVDKNIWLHFVAQRQGNWFVGSCQNISSSAQQKLRLDKIIALQETILDSANFTIIATNADGTITHFNKISEKLLGYSSQEVVGCQTPYLFHLPEEVRDYAKSLEDQLNRSIPVGFSTLTSRLCRGGVDEQEWTYVKKGGQTFPVIVSVTAILDNSKKIAGYLLIGKDISQQKQVERYSHQLSTILTTAGELASFSGFLYDVNKGEFQITSDRFRHIITSIIKKETILLSDIMSFYQEGERESTLEIFKNSINKEISFDFQAKLIESDNLTIKWLRTVGIPQIEKGNVTSILGFIQDVSASKFLEEKLSQQAQTDELTQIPNRRALMVQLDCEWLRYARYHKQSSILIIDIDHFKHVNDQWGHDAGDFALKKISSLLSEQLRQTDVLGRLGGEEFLVLIPSYNETGALLLAEKLRKTIDTSIISYKPPFQTTAIDMSITISIGACSLYNNNIQSANQWLVAADKALYYAKHNGRNQVIAYNQLSDV